MPTTAKTDSLLRPFVAVIALAAWTSVEANPDLQGDARQITPGTDTELVLTDMGFLKYHPDEYFRQLGVQALTQGRYDMALGYFERSARYADKLSQAAIAEMHFLGRGVEVDRARGYAWMDLAAERGHERFLVPRERYWAQLDEDERRRAVDIGQDIYAEYADDVAKARLELLMRRGRGQLTGSRLGSVGTLTVKLGDDGGSNSDIRGEHYYDQRLWDPELYWAWQDEVYNAQPAGRVDVLPLRQSPPTED